MQATKFVFLTDIHYGFERRHGHKIAIHDAAAVDLALRFVKDFKPDHVILGGDILDCGAISHHNKQKPGRTEGMRILSDAQECRALVIEPLAKVANKTFITGNHEAWLTDLTDDIPGVDGMFDINTLLGLEKWKVVEQGGYFNLGRLFFIHGDTLSGSEMVAKNAVVNYEKSIRFGHFHTYSAYTKNSAIDYKFGRTGVACPCLCSKNPAYTKAKPNRWVQGLCYGWVFPDGGFADQVALITNQRMVANGKVYRG